MASNQVTLHTDHRALSCNIVTASYDTITCLTTRYTAGARLDDEHFAGHSGGGVNGFVGVAVNEFEVWGVGLDPDFNNSNYVLKNETSDLVVERPVPHHCY